MVDCWKCKQINTHAEKNSNAKMGKIQCPVCDKEVEGELSYVSTIKSLPSSYWDEARKSYQSSLKS